jgi:hypothetical protein
MSAENPSSNDPLEIRLSLDDLIAAYRVHARASLLRSLAIVTAAVTVGGLWSVSKSLSVMTIANVFVVLALILAFGIGIGILSQRFAIPFRARRIYRQQKNLQRPYQLSWDDANVRTASAEGSAATPWNDFLKWREGKYTFLLYRSDMLFQMFPKRAFHDQTQIDEFRRLAQQHISARAGRKRQD